ncbi:MAG: sulfite exporter TauE/SafE family protein [Deltaproteobacteria bacterium]|nr:sulfite exporter TauE/SafE family protein [Deltaproteobacteria bacterium]MBW1930492.1 sulfite exporter TauE/SafE family protein [Deltaproteobacteria bacterium]MBW2025453.1 sulfite exporter TauE/SafE family protein [Deltaproteobacteria bacterium]MBW2126103.1 sulfite exporter TauE/SafE family protein [Deltaproteobacteria bacterium]RLB14386.1 MAG: sulfite exporter TauE/SafE family protein [Deltaproteobacteria bacterium]
MHFPISGVEVSPILPVAVAFGVSFFTSMGGVSGAFLLLPFQVSVLHFTSPAVSPTNLVYNIIGIPGGVYRYIREGRMAWPLALVIICGTLPGVFIGAILRIRYLPDPRHFKVFVGCVLLYIGIRLLYDLTSKAKVAKTKTTELEERFKQKAGKMHGISPDAHKSSISTVRFSLSKYTFQFYGETFTFHTTLVFALTFCVGIISGTYGIGGGAIVAPFLIAIFRLPVYAIAGATLLSTFLTSVVGVAFYTLIAPFYAYTGLAITPDWKLGVLFGLGGLMGMYCGARTQKYFSARLIKLILGMLIVMLALRYISNVF